MGLLPNAHFGEANKPLPNWRLAKRSVVDDEDDDEIMATTPEDVAGILGFDPLEIELEKGGEGSGNFGHEGRPGEVGGSGEGGSSTSVGGITIGSGGQLTLGDPKDFVFGSSRDRLHSYHWEMPGLEVKSIQQSDAKKYFDKNMVQSVLDKSGLIGIATSVSASVIIFDEKKSEGGRGPREAARNIGNGLLRIHVNAGKPGTGKFVDSESLADSLDHEIAHNTYNGDSKIQNSFRLIFDKEYKEINALDKLEMQSYTEEKRVGEFFVRCSSYLFHGIKNLDNLPKTKGFLVDLFNKMGKGIRTSK